MRESCIVDVQPFARLVLSFWAMFELLLVSFEILPNFAWHEIRSALPYISYIRQELRKVLLA